MNPFAPLLNAARVLGQAANPAHVGREAARYHIAVPTDARSRLAAGWLLLGTGALVLSGLFSLLLVLSRTRDQTVMIGDDIEVTVVDIRGDKVRLGITAPKDIAVHRKEVYEAIKRENRAAAQVKPDDLPNVGRVVALPAAPTPKP